MNSDSRLCFVDIVLADLTSFYWTCGSSKHCFIEEIVQFSHCSHDIYSTNESVQLQGVTGVKQVVFNVTYDLKI